MDILIITTLYLEGYKGRQIITVFISGKLSTRWRVEDIYINIYVEVVHETMSHYSEQKKERLNALKSYIADEGPLDIEAVSAEMAIEYGLSEKKFDEYLDTLEAAGHIEVDREERQVKVTDQ